jgi:hypothetical protein
MSLEFNIFIDGIYQGTTSELSWNTSKIYTKPPLPFGEGYYLPLPYGNVFTWRVDTYDTETELTTIGDEWIFTTMQQWGSEKPEDVNNKIWIPDIDDEEDFGDWAAISDNFDLYFAGGGRYSKQTVVVTLDSDGKGKIFIGE